METEQTKANEAITQAGAEAAEWQYRPLVPLEQMENKMWEQSYEVPS